MNVMKNIYKYPCSLWPILNLCFFPRTFDFHFASFLGFLRICSGQTGLTKPYSSGPGDLEHKPFRNYTRNYTQRCCQRTFQMNVQETTSYMSESSSSFCSVTASCFFFGFCSLLEGLAGAAFLLFLENTVHLK